ncbi:MAG: hypothetical protein ACRETA_12175 [Gammaproteobacteria bacterium]
MIASTSFDLITAVSSVGVSLFIAITGGTFYLGRLHGRTAEQFLALSRQLIGLNARLDHQDLAIDDLKVFVGDGGSAIRHDLERIDAMGTQAAIGALAQLRDRTVRLEVLTGHEKH